jgi:hypothetical protein
MKHYIISEEQIRQLTLHMISVNQLETRLPELKRLSDEEIKDLADAANPEGEMRALLTKFPSGVLATFAHAIMDKLGVPE